MSDDEKKRAAERLKTAKSDLADEAIKSFARGLEQKWNLMCEKRATMRMWFLIVNHRLDFSYAFGAGTEAPSWVDPVLLGEFIVRAMEKFKREHVPPEPYKTTRTDGREVTYDRHVEIRWGEGVGSARGSSSGRKPAFEAVQRGFESLSPNYQRTMLIRLTPKATTGGRPPTDAGVRLVSMTTRGSLLAKAAARRGRVVDDPEREFPLAFRDAEDFEEIAHPEQWTWIVIHDFPVKDLDPASETEYLEELEAAAGDEDDEEMAQASLDRYYECVQAINAGAKFPPILVDMGGVILDGNHRVASLYDDDPDAAIDVLWATKPIRSNRRRLRP